MTIAEIELPIPGAATPATGAIMKAYDTFGNAAHEGALKVVLRR